MKNFINEFKQFIQRGSVMDMAVGVLIGAAFKAIVDALVNNILSPLLGLFVRSDFSTLAFTVAGVQIQYGAFFMAVINFFLVAFVLFMLVKVLNRVRRQPKEEPKAPAAKQCPYCKSDIALAATRCPHCTSILNE